MEECQRMELPVLGPDVNESLKGFSVPQSNTIRFGMNAVKGVGEAAVEDIIAERESSGPYMSVYDFICRINQKTVNKKTLESLVWPAPWMASKSCIAPSTSSRRRLTR